MTDAATTAVPQTGLGASTTSSSDLIGDVASSFEEAFATQVALQEIMLDYQIRSEALRSISEGVQKNIDVVENERQDISQSQE